MTAPYAAGYAGEIRVSAPHPRSYRPAIPLGCPPVSWKQTAEEMKAYCRVHGIRFTGPALCKAIGKPSGSPVPRGVADSYLAGQLRAFNPS